MTTTEQAIVYGWLFLITLGGLALFAGWIGHRHELKALWRDIFALIELREAMVLKQPQKPKRTVSKARVPYKLTPPAEKGSVIDLSTPLAERSRVVPFSEEPQAVAASGVGGSKPDGDGGGEAA